MMMNGVNPELKREAQQLRRLNNYGGFAYVRSLSRRCRRWLSVVFIFDSKDLLVFGVLAMGIEDWGS